MCNCTCAFAGTLEVDFIGVFPWKERLMSVGSCASLSNKGETGTSCALWGRLAMEGGRKGRRKKDGEAVHYSQIMHLSRRLSPLYLTWLLCLLSHSLLALLVSHSQLVLKPTYLSISNRCCFLLSWARWSNTSGRSSRLRFCRCEADSEVLPLYHIKHACEKLPIS